MTEYEDVLADAWRKHEAPREPGAPTVISTFAGCGGSSLGYSIAGAQELAVVEWNDHAVETFRLNFPHVPHVFHGDIREVSVAELLTVTGLGVGDLTLFDGSPPCQGFSTSGKRKLDDPRNQLFREYVRLLGGLAPRGFIMENVAGMVKGRMRLLFREVVKELSAAGPGYQVKAWLLNSADYGVPSARPRVLFVGVRRDLELEPSIPPPAGPRRSVKQALDGLPDPGPYLPLSGIVARLAPFMREGEQGSDAFERAGYKGSSWDLRRLYWDRPAPTVMSTLNSRAGFLHPEYDRFLGVEEVKRVCSYPDPFRFPGEPSDPQKESGGYVVDAFARIGNSVMPLFMAQIARHVTGLLAPGRTP